MGHALILIDLNEAFAESMRCDPDNSVYLRVEIRTAAKCLHRDGVFLDSLVPAFEVFFADELQHADEILRAAQKARGEEPLQFFSFRLYCG
jgi:hypothetical protein